MRSSDGRLDIRLSTPGSERIGTNPEQLFATGWPAGFERTIALAAYKKRVTLPADLTIDAEVDLNVAGGRYFLSARFRVNLPGVEREVSQALLIEARQICPLLERDQRQRGRRDRVDRQPRIVRANHMTNSSHRENENVHKWGQDDTSGRVCFREKLKVPVSNFVHVVDDDKTVLDSLGDLLRSMDYRVTLHGSVAEFLDAELPDAPSCLLLDVRLPRTSGLEFQDYLARNDIRLPIILMTGYGDVPMSVKAMKAGAVDFLTKPIRHQDLLDAVATAIRMDHDQRQKAERIAELRKRYELLTPRERQVVALVASGLMNKQIANELSINEVTVKMHRGSAMRKLQLRSAAQLARIAYPLFDDNPRDPA